MQTNLKTIQSRLRQTMTSLPYKVGVLCVAFTKDRFRYQNWLDNYPEAWKPRSRRAKRNKGRAILTDTARLKRSVRVLSTTRNSVTVGSDLPYAAAHNEGFRGTVTIPAHRRKRFHKSKVMSINEVTKKGRRKTKTVTTLTGESEVKQHTRRMNVPRRRFLGNSMYLRQQISRLITAEINKIFK